MKTINQNQIRRLQIPNATEAKAENIRLSELVVLEDTGILYICRDEKTNDDDIPLDNGKYLFDVLSVVPYLVDVEPGNIPMASSDGRTLTDSHVKVLDDGSVQVSSSSITIGDKTISSLGNSVGLHHYFEGDDQAFTMSAVGGDTGPVHRILEGDKSLFEACSDGVQISSHTSPWIDGYYKMVRETGYLNMSLMSTASLDDLHSHLYVDSATRRVIMRFLNKSWHVLHLPEGSEFFDKVLAGDSIEGVEVIWDDIEMLTENSMTYNDLPYIKPDGSESILYPDNSVVLINHTTSITSTNNVRVLHDPFTVYSENAVQEVKMYVTDVNGDDVWTYGYFDLEEGFNHLSPDKVHDFDPQEYFVKFASKKGDVSLRGVETPDGDAKIHLYMPYIPYRDETLANLQVEGEMVKSIELGSGLFKGPGEGGSIVLSSNGLTQYVMELDGLSSTLVVQHNLHRYVSSAELIELDGSPSELYVTNKDGDGNISTQTATVISPVPLSGTLIIE